MRLRDTLKFLSKARQKSIDDLLEAQKIHKQWAEVPESQQPWAGGAARHREIANEKDIAINNLRNKTENDPESLGLVNRWQQSHVDWKQRVLEEPPMAKTAGDAAWHDRWVASYGEMIKQLKDKNLVLPLTATGIGASLYSPEAARAKSNKDLEEKWEGGGLQDAYDPVDMALAAITGGGSMTMRMAQAALDPVISYIMDSFGSDE